MEELPLYKVSHEGVGEGLEMVALTDSPAIMVKGVLMRQAKKLVFANEDRRIIAGPALIPNMAIYRNDEDGEYNVKFSEEEVRDLVKKYKLDGLANQFNVEHTKVKAPMIMLHDWIIENPDCDTSNQYGFTGERALPKGTWFVMAYVEDIKFWNDEVKAKEKTGFSIEGLLGLKLKRQKMESVKLKFINALIEDGTKVYAEAFEDGKELFVIDENGDKTLIFDGEHMLDDGTVISTVGGKITEIKPKQDDVAAAEDKEKEEVKASEDEVKEEVKSEIKAEEIPVIAGLDEAAVLALIQPIIDEVYKVIALLKTEIGDEEEKEEVPMLMTRSQQKMAQIKKLENYISNNKNK